MVATKKEIQDLLRQHEAIRAHMKFLTRALKDLTAQSHRGTAAELKDRVTLYRWSLYDFREAIRRHIELDERIFNMLLSEGLSAEMDRGHDEIRRQIDEIVAIAENAVYGGLNRQELIKSAAAIKKAVSDLCNTCQSHISMEDSILEPALKGF